MKLGSRVLPETIPEVRCETGFVGYMVSQITSLWCPTLSCRMEDSPVTRREIDAVHVERAHFSPADFDLRVSLIQIRSRLSALNHKEKANE